MERMDAVDKKTQYCGYPSPGWLQVMIIKLYKQWRSGYMLRRSVERFKARKQLQPKDSDVVRSNPCIPSTHQIKEGKAKNVGTILQFTRQQRIEQPTS
jgi:hypothetical protein